MCTGNIKTRSLGEQLLLCGISKAKSMQGVHPWRTVLSQ
jgi:hypothetical protein